MQKGFVSVLLIVVILFLMAVMASDLVIGAKSERRPISKCNLYNNCPTSTPLPTPKPIVNLIILAADSTQFDNYLELKNLATEVSYRSVPYDHGEINNWDLQSRNYFLTVSSSDFPAFQSKPLYNYDISSLSEIAKRNTNKGFYVHETLTYLASINSWDWNKARDTFDYAWMDQVVSFAKTNNKKVIWSEPSYAWKTLYESEAVKNKLGQWGNTLVPMYATNFPDQVSSAKQYAQSVTTQFGMALGESHQGWHWRDQNPGIEPTRLGSLQLAQDGLNSGAMYFQFEGAPADFKWDSPYMLGVRDFANYLQAQ